MKKIYHNLIILGIVAVLASCRKEPCQKCLEAQNRLMADGLEANATLVIDVYGLPLSVTRTETERGISLLDLAVYDASGALEWSSHIDNPTNARQTATGLEAGKKTVCAVANLPTGCFPQTLEEFETFASVLSDNGEGFVMTGSGKGEASPNPEPVPVKLSRLAAKVSLEGYIVTNWTEKTPASFDITDIYLANVSAESSLAFASSDPSVNLRSKVELVEDEVTRALTVAPKENWTPGDLFNGGVNFYCYPNASETRTCVMIKALYDGRVCYYPLVIEREIINNTWYRFGNVTITCEGVENPWEDFTHLKTSFEISISGWDYNEYPEISF